MEYKSSELKAGIFIIISAVVFIAFLVMIIGLSRWEDKDQYRTSFRYVGGIEKGSLVRYSGLEVGRVTGMNAPAEGDQGIEVVLEVKKGTPVHVDSRAFMTTVGLLGSFYIEITAGNPDTTLLPPGSVIPSKDITAYAQMSGSVTQITDETTELLRNLNQIMDKQNRNNIKETLAALAEISTTSANNLSAIETNLNTVIKNLDHTIESVNQLLEKNDSSITNSIQGLESLVSQSNEIVDNLNKVVKNMDYHIAENGDSYAEMISHLNALIRNLEIFSQSIKEQPWNLVRKTPLPERELP